MMDDAIRRLSAARRLSEAARRAEASLEKFGNTAFRATCDAWRIKLSRLVSANEAAEIVAAVVARNITLDESLQLAFEFIAAGCGQQRTLRYLDAVKWEKAAARHVL